MRTNCPRGILMLLLLALAAALGGCAVTEPQRQSLAAHVQAMEQVQIGADDLLTDYAQSQQRSAPSATGERAAPAYPTEFVLPPDADAAPATDIGRAIASTRRALAVMRQYDAALVALAEGRSNDDVRGQIVGLGGALQSLGELAGATIGSVLPYATIGARVLKLAQDASNRRQLQQAVAEGREPVITILTALERQAPAMYGDSVTRARAAQTAAANDVRRLAPALRSFVARHGPPVDAGVAGSVAELQAEIAQIGRDTGTREALPLPFAYGTGRPPLDAAALGETQAFAIALRALSRRHADVVTRQQAYHTAVARYVAALRQARASMDLLAANLAGPPDLRAETAQLFQAAFGLRDAIATYRNPPPGG